MLRFGKTKVVKEEIHGAKKLIIIWDVDVDYIVISKLIEMKNNPKYLTAYLDEVIRPLVLILHEMSGCVRTFKDKDGDKNKNNYKLMSLHIADDKLIEKHKTIWTKTENLINIELKTLPVSDKRYIKP